MNTLRPMVLVLLLSITGCAVETPRYTQIMVLRAGESAPPPGSAPGIVWRIDESDLKALSPTPVVPAPPPPQLLPPPRPNAEQPSYYGPPVYWGPRW